MGAEWVAAIGLAGRFVRRLRAGGAAESAVSAAVTAELYFRRAGRFRGRADKHLQQFISRLLRWVEPESTHPEPGGEGGSISFRARVPAGRNTPGGAEESGPHRGSQAHRGA